MYIPQILWLVEKLEPDKNENRKSEMRWEDHRKMEEDNRTKQDIIKR